MPPAFDGLELLFIPEGWLRIARRFNAGFEVGQQRVPKGWPRQSDSAVPLGLNLLTTVIPALKCRAIFSHPSGITNRNSGGTRAGALTGRVFETVGFIGRMAWVRQPGIRPPKRRLVFGFVLRPRSFPARLAGICPWSAASDVTRQR